MSLLGDGGDVKRPLSKCASPLRNKEFSTLQAVFRALRLRIAYETNAFAFSELEATLNARGKWSGHSAEQRYERHRSERFFLDPLFFASEANQLLLAFGTDRHQQAATDFQLLQEGFRHSQWSGRYEDSIEWRVCLPARDAIAIAESDVAYPKLLDALLGTNH